MEVYPPLSDHSVAGIVSYRINLFVYLSIAYLYRITQLHSVDAYVTDLSPILSISGAVNNSEVDLRSGSIVPHCSGDGYPPPTYRWRDLSTNDIKEIDGSTYTIPSAAEYHVECAASNNVILANGSRIPHTMSTRFYITGLSDCVFTSLVLVCCV